MSVGQVSANEGTISPLPSENYRQFVRRAHNSLLPHIPDPDQRNEAVWNAWDSAYGDVLRERAQAYFDPEQYRFVPSVCYFKEHETRGRDGTPLKYGFNELCDIMDANNGRCDVDAYSAIASHHTDDRLKGDKYEPRVVGYAGPYRMGMIGRLKPEWAIFADEHHQANEAPLFASRRRRSVEVMRYKDGRPSYFDPIATLGADSPRLAMPVARYEASDEVEVERYSFVAPVSVSGSNTFLPGSKEPRCSQYAVPDSSEQEPMNSMSQVGPSEVQAIVEAIRSTPEFRWVAEQMNASTGGNTNPSQDLMPPGGSGGATPPLAPPPPNPLEQSSGAPSMPSAPSSMQPPGQFSAHSQYGMPHQPHQYSVEGDEDMAETERYAAMQEEIAVLQDRYSEVVERNSQLEANNRAIIEDHARMRSAVVALEQRAVDSERLVRIKELYSEYPHVIEEDELVKECLYSAGATLNNEQFENHMAMAERYAKKATPVAGMVPRGESSFASSDSQTEEFVNAIKERFSAYQDRGIDKSYDELEAEIKRERGLLPPVA